MEKKNIFSWIAVFSIIMGLWMFYVLLVEDYPWPIDTIQGNIWFVLSAALAGVSIGVLLDRFLFGDGKW